MMQIGGGGERCSNRLENLVKKTLDSWLLPLEFPDQSKISSHGYMSIYHETVLALRCVGTQMCARWKLKLLQKGKKEKVSRQVLCFMQLSNTTLICIWKCSKRRRRRRKDLLKICLLCFASLLNPLNTKESLSCCSVQQPWNFKLLKFWNSSNPRSIRRRILKS
jgi:hypothetical protein